MVIIIFLVTTISFGLMGSYLLNKNNKVKRRIRQFITIEQAENKSEQERTEKKKPQLKEFISVLAKNIRASENQRVTLETELERAGIPLKVEEFITIRIILFFMVFILTLVMGIHPLLSILIGLIGWKIPSLYLQKKKNKRIADFTAQLPEALETMGSAIKSGFSFMQAMQLVSKEMPDPIGIEFRKTIKEMNLGISTEVAFENLLNRLPNKDLEIVVTAVLIQRSTGGNLAQMLETIHETISERVRMKDELKALTSQGRMSAIVISLLPVILGLILNVMNPDYFTPMFSHPLGWVLLGGGAVSGLLGWVFINKIVNIEV
ncbi:type II secretion system F family protein [Niallia sp. Krafla_26]|uniref:type II secretion system F family protein n=1 Tax=Niallia sp. Krafla_26 TaxID=3064703 RepID=UPI003D171BB0